MQNTPPPTHFFVVDTFFTVCTVFGTCVSFFSSPTSVEGLKRIHRSPGSGVLAVAPLALGERERAWH